MKRGDRLAIRGVALLLAGLLLAGCTGTGSAPANQTGGSGTGSGAGSAPANQTGASGTGSGTGSGAGSAPAGQTGTATPCTATSTALDPQAGRNGSGIALKPPQNPAPSSATPWLRYMTVGNLEVLPNGGRVLGDSFLVRPGTAVVPTAETVVRVELTPALPESWVAENLVLEGVTPLDRQIGGQGDWGTVSFRLAPGKAGEQFRITLKSVIDNEGKVGEYTVAFCRQDPPRAEVQFLNGAAWAPVTASIPAEGPARLRVIFSDPMRRTTVEEAIRRSTSADSITGSTWIDDRTLEVTVKAGLPVIALNLVGSQDLNGLYLAGGLPRVYRGDPARLVALDPDSGQSRNLADLPHEVQGSRLLPGGERVFVHTLQYPGGYESHPSWTSLLVPLDGGKPEQITESGRVWAQWLDSGDQVEFQRDRGRLTLVRHGRSGAVSQELKDLPDHFETYLSPDGRWLVLLAPLPQTGEYSAWTRSSVLVIDLQTGARRELKEQVDLLRPGKDGIWIPTPAWSPDSTQLVIPQGRDGVPEVHLLDPAAGSMRLLAKGKELGGHLRWSPDSKRLLVGQTLLDASSGAVLHQVAEKGWVVGFSPDGTMLLLSESDGGDWGRIKLYSLKSGEVRSLGEGRPVGWAPNGEVLIVRWAGYRHRVTYGL